MSPTTPDPVLNVPAWRVPGRIVLIHDDPREGAPPPGLGAEMDAVAAALARSGVEVILLVNGWIPTAGQAVGQGIRRIGLGGMTGDPAALDEALGVFKPGAVIIFGDGQGRPGLPEAARRRSLPLALDVCGLGDAPEQAQAARRWLERGSGSVCVADLAVGERLRDWGVPTARLRCADSPAARAEAIRELLVVTAPEPPVVPAAPKPRPVAMDPAPATQVSPPPAPMATPARPEAATAPAPDFKAASHRFYKLGDIGGSLDILGGLLKAGAQFDKAQRDTLEFIRGLHRLKSGWNLPPRQPNPGLLTRPGHLLYCLHQSVPHATNGYSTRSHGIAVGLRQSGWHVRATTRPGFPYDIGLTGLTKGYHEACIDDVTYAAVAGWNLSKTPLDHYLAEAADHFLREAQTSGAEIIVAASNHITALPALAAARRLGLPFVYEVRGLWEITQASTQPEWADSERFRLMRTLEAQTAREADLLMTLTTELADELVARGADRSRIVIVPNAVDADRFRPSPPDPEIVRELGLPPNTPVIGYAGSAVAYEGLELLLEALAELTRQNLAYTFVLVGDGKVFDTVKERARELGIEPHCRFTGRVPFDRVPRYLACMDILPVPRLSSAVTEMVSPLKPLEAMAMGKAVVLSDVSPHRIFAGDNERARLFGKDSRPALVEALKALMTQPRERERLGQAARRWIERERTWKTVTATYTRALESLKSERRRERIAHAPARRLEDITLGLIADRFTTDTLASAVRVLPLTPDGWREQLGRQPIDALFVESAWKGNDGIWHRKVGHYSDEEFADLRALLAHCREQGIPSLFWNKEDPVHFERFRKTAALCDHVFTTDSRRIIPYLATPNARTRTASSLPFYASPGIHNLLPSTRPWRHTAAYGGTYYGARYPERTELMDRIMSAAAPLGLTIYDRQQNDPESPYKYPGGLAGYVAGSLDYDDMIQAYKAHPLQINVNSVLDSPTMFSRRVMEAAACGAPILSGPALGMNRYLEGAGLVVRTETEAARALENLLREPAYRWRTALAGARAVMRAHTTGHRLTQMLRTAGIVMEAPAMPRIGVLVPRITDLAAEALLGQTLRPVLVKSDIWLGGTLERLLKAGIDCAVDMTPSETHVSAWLLVRVAADLECLEPDDLEDLAWTHAYSPHAVTGLSRSDKADDAWPGVATTAIGADTSLRLIRAPLEARDFAEGREWALRQTPLVLRKPPVRHAHPPDRPPRRTVLIAGHDLKFIRPFYPHFAKSGLRLLLDFWNGHNQHDEAISKRLLQQADTVFCEWMLGNAVWYGKHKRPGQRLVGRFHLQEVDSPLFGKIAFAAFDKVFFVGPHILRKAIAKNPVLKTNGIVIFNGVDVEALTSVPRATTHGKVLGFVGIVPQRKRFDLALDILGKLRALDPGYTLRIKGKLPRDFPWMASRQVEMDWFNAQFQRIETDPLLKGAVFFDPQGNDMPEWYAGIDFVLSTSDFESFHFTIADGAAAGCLPVVLPWEGADEIYPGDWIAADTDAAVSRIRTSERAPAAQRANADYASTRFSLAAISRKLVDVVTGETPSSP